MIPEEDIRIALGAYGIEPNSVSYLTSGENCAVYRVDADGKQYVARLRSAYATPAEVLFTVRWTQAVSSEVLVPVSLPPIASIPTIGGRCLDVAPYFAHDHTNGGEVGPNAWILVGGMLGAMHRLGSHLVGDAPRELPYGNYPHERLVRGHMSRARRNAPHEYQSLLTEVECLLQRAIDAVGIRECGLHVGVVHGDMHFWNVLYAGGIPVGIIDFDFLQRGILIFDVAYACLWLSAWERERGNEWTDISVRYIRAYEEARQQDLSIEETACLPWCQVWLNVFFFLSSFQNSADDIERSIEVDLLPAQVLAATL